MPCNQETCAEYTPNTDGTCGPACSSPCGVDYEKKVSPAWDTSRIDAPTWQRDRIMYYYDDYCETPGLNTPDGSAGAGDATATEPESEQVQWGLTSDTNPYGGRICKTIPTGFWWQNRDDLCPNYSGFGNYGTYNTRTTPIKRRYWEHYPSEISFEPIRSDSWFYYLYKTENGVTGQPCHVMCYYMYTTTTTGYGDGFQASDYPTATTNTRSYSTYYGIRKVPYECPCTPEQTYINYSLEDGKITPEDDPDPYPLVWTCGTRDNRIAFTYPGSQVSADVEIRAYGIEGQDVGQSQLGSWTSMLNVAGLSLGELYTEIGPAEGFLKNESSGHRYHTELEVRSGDTVLARLRATFRPFQGVGDGGNDDSKFRIKNISINGTGSNSIQENTTYELWGRRESNTKRYNKIGEVRFPTIVRSSEKSGIPVTFHVNEASVQVGPGNNGQSLDSLGYYAAWDGVKGLSYMSPAGNGVWESENTVVVRDYTLPGGTILRMELRSYLDSGSGNYYTRWKILNVVRPGNGYESGDGVNYSGQDVYYMYYPSADATNKVGISIMVSATYNGDYSEGQNLMSVGDTINGWTIANLKHSDEDFNMHIAEIYGGTSDFQKDTVYTSSSGIDAFVRAGWGIADRAIIIGRYEFQRKEIVYSTAIPNPEVPFEGLDVVKPKLQAVISNGKLTKVQILNPGKNLKSTLIEPIKIAVQYPPSYVNQTKYLQYLEEGVDPDEALKRSKGGSKPAKVEPVFTGSELTGVKIISGGSGYSSSQPPFVTVPYIARSYKQVLKSGQTAESQEQSAKEMFTRSEAFKKLSTTPYSYDVVVNASDDPTSNQAPVLNAEGFFDGKYEVDPTRNKTEKVSKTGFSYEDYLKAQEPVHSEKSNVYLKGPIKELQKTKDSEIYVRPKSGFAKENAQYYLQPSNPDRSGAKKSTDLKNLHAAIDKQSQSNADVYKSYSSKQQELINDVSLDDPISRTSSTINNTSIEQAKTIGLSVSNTDDGKYYGKAFKDFYKTYTKTDKTFENTLNQIDTQYEKDINGMWEMDLDSNRTLIYDGAKQSRVKYAFYNLPCASSKEIYLIKGYCPDPRRNTFMKVNVGVKMPFDYDNDRGPCLECIYSDSAVMDAYDDLVDNYGANNVELADAWCQIYYAAAAYNGEIDGQSYGIPRTGGYTLPYASTYGFAGYTLGYVQSQFGPQYIYEGCRDYEFSGNLEILHDLSLETKTFVDAVNKYGNPYDLKCARRYEDSLIIDEAAINNFIGAVDTYDPTAPAQLSDPLVEE